MAASVQLSPLWCTLSSCKVFQRHIQLIAFEPMHACDKERITARNKYCFTSLPLCQWLSIALKLSESWAQFFLRETSEIMHFLFILYTHPSPALAHAFCVID